MPILKKHIENYSTLLVEQSNIESSFTKIDRKVDQVFYLYKYLIWNNNII